MLLMIMHCSEYIVSSIISQPLPDVIISNVITISIIIFIYHCIYSTCYHLCSRFIGPSETRGGQIRLWWVAYYSRYTDWDIDVLIDNFIDGWIGWLIDCLIDGWIGWLIDCLIDCLISWLIDWLINRGSMWPQPRLWPTISHSHGQQAGSRGQLASWWAIVLPY